VRELNYRRWQQQAESLLSRVACKCSFYFTQITTSTKFNSTCRCQIAHKLSFGSSPVVLCVQTNGRMDWRTDGRINNRRSTRMRMRVKEEHCTGYSDTQAYNKHRTRYDQIIWFGTFRGKLNAWGIKQRSHFLLQCDAVKYGRNLRDTAYYDINLREPVYFDRNLRDTL
jgi:hypothetical protein